MAEEAQPVVWTYAARADLLEALEYLVDKSPDAAAAFLADVENLAASLAQFPERGAVVGELEFGKPSSGFASDDIGSFTESSTVESPS